MKKLAALVLFLFWIIGTVLLICTIIGALFLAIYTPWWIIPHEIVDYILDN